MQRKWIRLALAVIAVPVATIGVFHMVRAYEAGTAFQPNGSGRDLQVNQVVFSGEEDTTAQKNGEEPNGESELWEKDKTAEDALRPQVKNAADYLFQTGRMDLPEGADTISLAEEEATHNPSLLPDNQDRTQGTEKDGYVYDVVDKTENADSVIGIGSGEDGTQTGGNTTGNGGTAGNGQVQTTPQPSAGPSSPQPNPGPATTTAPVPTAAPVINPADTAIDPEGEKNNNTNLTKPHPYDEDKVGDADQVEIVTIAQTNEGVQLYKGQTIEGITVYNALITQIKTKDGTFYSWGKDHYDRYVRITGVSFDQGKTWQKLPLQIPTELAEGSMLIRAEYRFSESSEDWTEELIPYTPRDSRIFVLSEKLKEANQVISTDKIINNQYIDQYKSENSTLNLLRMQNKFLGEGRLQALFPGWTENGKLVSWFYEATLGRHILEPADLVPLDDKYTVQLEMVWLTDDYRLVPKGEAGGNLCYLQTLTDVEETKSSRFLRMAGLQPQAASQTLTVPEYVQAVDIDTDAGLSVDYLALPDSVILVESSEGLKVNKGYEVDAGNPYYCSTDDGLLMDTEETTIYAIPYERETLTIPAKVQKVSLTVPNQLHSIRLEQTDAQALPQIDLKLLQDCNVIVPDTLLDAYLIEHRTLLTRENGLSVSAASKPEVTYTVMEDTVQNNAGELCKIISGEKESLVVPKGTKTIQSGAFDGEQHIKTLYFPEDGSTIRLARDCFANSSIETILCYSEKQYEEVIRQLEQAGGSGIQVELLKISREGYYYQITEKDGVQNNVLVRTPKSLTEYDGTVTDTEGNPVKIQKIGDNAFENCTELKWVTLPEETDTIGDRAFKNCHALQGIMIQATEKITIGDHSLDGCEQLRFLGSNAMQGILVNDYYPEDAEDLLSYAPTDCEGYNAYFTSFTAESGIYSYQIVTTGTGDKMLYGADEDGTPWLLLRSGGEVGETVVLPESTIEIFQYALAGVDSTGDYFTLNWEELTSLVAVDDCAFQNSALGGVVELSYYGYMIGATAFAHCPKITEVRLTGTGDSLGRYIFYGCTGLEKATIGAMGYGAIYGGTFSGCDHLTDLYFTSPWAPELLVEGDYYRFNYEWTDAMERSDEAEHLRIHVPEGCEQTYIDDWRYVYAGYYDTTGGQEPVYLQMWKEIYDKHTVFDWEAQEWIYPSEEEVDAYLEEELLTAENELRQTMGLDAVTEPGNFYNYREKDGVITLLRVPSDSSIVMLESYWIGLPFGWYVNYIGTGTFARSTQLEEVYLPNNLMGIYTDVFAGAQLAKGTLTLHLTDSIPPELIRPDENTPFSFGVEDGQIALVLEESFWGDSPEEDTYVEAWAPALAENSSEEALEAARVRLRKMFAAGRGEEYVPATEKLPSVSDGNAGSTVSGSDIGSVSVLQTESNRTQEESK